MIRWNSSLKARFSRTATGAPSKAPRKRTRLRFFGLRTGAPRPVGQFFTPAPAVASRGQALRFQRSIACPCDFVQCVIVSQGGTAEYGADPPACLKRSRAVIFSFKRFGLALIALRRNGTVTDPVYVSADAACTGAAKDKKHLRGRVSRCSRKTPTP